MKNNLKYIPDSSVVEVLLAMESRPRMYASTPGSLWETYHALTNLLYSYDEESHNRYRSIETKVNYKFKNYTNIPFCHTEEVKDDFDLAVRFLKEFRTELEKD